MRPYTFGSFGVLLLFLLPPILWLFPQSLFAEDDLRDLARHDYDELVAHPEARIDVPEHYEEKLTKHFLYVYPSGGRARARDLMARGESVRARYVREIGVDSPGIIRVYLAANGRDFQRMQPGGARLPDWVAGVAYPSLDAILLRQAASDGHPIDLFRTFEHELSHVVFRRAVGDARTPKWFVEGLAQWQAHEFDFHRSQRLSFAAFTNSLIPIEKLRTSFPRGVGDIRQAYDQSYDFVSFLVGEYGEEAFRRFVRRLGAGEEFFRALESETGLDLEELEKKWISELKLSYSWLPLITSGATVWTVASVLILIGYARKRREKARKLQRMEEEERAAEMALRIPVAYPLRDADRPDAPKRRGPTIH